MSHIFLSYRKRDQELGEALKARLEDEGYTVWWDRQIPPGADFGVVLEERLRSADAVITLWTRNSVRSKWVYFETLMAHEMDKLVPLQFDDCEIPMGLHRIHKYRYDPSCPRDSQQWQEILRRIGQAIERGKASDEIVASLDELVWRKIKTGRDVQDIEDFLDRYPNSVWADEARALLVDLKPKRRLESTVWWSFGLLFYLMLVIPFVTLHFDYAPQEAWYYTSLYFPFFGFFATFGLMMVPIYSFTLAKALRYGFSQGFAFRAGSLGSRITTLAVLVVAPIVTCATITVLEVRDGYAPWQFTPEVLSMPVRSLAPGVAGLQDLRSPDIFDDARPLRGIFNAVQIFNLRSLLESRNSSPQDVPCVASPASAVDPPRLVRDPDCVVHMNNLQRVMEHAQHNPAYNSYTSYAYRYCFFFFALAFMGTYFNIYVMTVRSERARVWMAHLSPWSGQRYSQLLHLFALQLLFISVWFISRMLFQLETQTILPSSGRGQFSQVIRNSYFLFFIVYLICIGFIVAAAFRCRNRYTRAGIVLIATVTAAMIAFAFSVTWFCQALQQFIGVHATPASTVVLSIIMIFVLFVPLVLPNLVPTKEEEIGV